MELQTTHFYPRLIHLGRTSIGPLLQLLLQLLLQFSYLQKSYRASYPSAPFFCACGPKRRPKKTFQFSTDRQERAYFCLLLGSRTGTDSNHHSVIQFKLSEARPLRTRSLGRFTVRIKNTQTNTMRGDISDYQFMNPFMIVRDNVSPVTSGHMRGTGQKLVGMRVV